MWEPTYVHDIVLRARDNCELVLLQLLAENCVLWFGETLETQADLDAVNNIWWDMWGVLLDLSDIMDEVTADRVDLWAASFAANGFDADAIGDFPDDAKGDTALMRHHAELLFDRFEHDLRQLGLRQLGRVRPLSTPVSTPALVKGRQHRNQGHAQRRR
jgi:hypothetical protein